MKVYYIKDGIIAETLDCTYENGRVTFSTNHLSVYSIGYESSSEPMNLFLIISIGTAVMIICIAATCSSSE